ncbi:ABC-2 type transporter [Kribbella flavida DSM 17836]|uniref:Transport permease protein n=1 Tax=Kribbella flavida (strain DSM 17836 / JCM 10339 / NBRC 14399) TaxID=479435 RepID=D2PQJ5_KRIFD|nr:ABC transporter permease [Kribbella flavida]ADB29182.1 ABC-2 type transporter [Kribbella flavida DSM 17836]
MSATLHPLADTSTMLRRNLRHALRYPSMTLGTLGMPVIMLLLFGFVFGKTFEAGLGGGGFDYLDFLVPGILLVTVGSGTVPIAVAVCTDMTEGIVARFRTMAIFRSAVLTGHVIGSVLQTLLGLALVIGVSVALGFRPSANVVEWLLAIALLTATTVALVWLAVALGLTAKTPEGASNVVLPISFVLPFLSSTFVPIESMPAGIRWFAEYQPFTPIIETLRGLLLGTPIENGNGWLAAAWCVAITTVGYFWAQSNYNKGTLA